MFCPPRERRWRISRFHLFPSDMVSKSLKKVRVFFLQLMAVLVFAQLDNNAMPTEGGQRGSGSTLAQPQKQDWKSMPLDQNYDDDNGVDGGDDDDDDG